MVEKTYPTQTGINPTLKKYPIEIAYWDEKPDPYTYKMPHRHEFDEVLFFRNGGGTHEINFNLYPIKDFSIHLVKTNTVHFIQRDKNSTGFNVAFDALKVEEINPTIRFPFLNQPNSIEVVQNLRKDQFIELDKIAEILSIQIKENDEFYKDKCFLLAFDLLMNKLSSHFLTEDSSKSTDELSSIVATFQNLVRKHAFNEHKVEWYTKKLHISGSHLYRKCKDEIHLSPKEIIQQYLLKESKRLLCESRLNCKQLAYEVGFESASHFHTFFRNQTGFSPGEYTKEINKSST